ncbi:MAG: SDR family NAD(P)-dependent oxidoreductase [Pseudomonadales bacterium]|nr:SDR family NAD(P)-dependent oxidoreductase [Pseudomonadales bacterium]
MRTIKGKIAVVTGAGSGIGQATCLALAKKGAIIVMVDMNKEGMKETATLVKGAGSTASSHVVDVTKLKQMEKLVKEVEDLHGRVHIVINNAGIGIMEEFVDGSLENFQKVIDVNLWGVVYGSKLFLPMLLKESEGHIVNTSSLAGIIATPGMVSYGTSKFAVRGFSESLRAELKRHNIGVSSVHPGMINTNIAKTSECDDASLHNTMVSWFERFGRPPSDVANKIVRAIEKNQMRVLVTPETYIMDVAKRIAPTISEEVGGRMMGMFRKAISPDYGKVKQKAVESDKKRETA